MDGLVEVRPRHAFAEIDGDRLRHELEVLDRDGLRRGERGQGRREQEQRHDRREHPGQDPRVPSPHANTIPTVPAATGPSGRVVGASLSAPFTELGREAERLGLTLSQAQLALCERYAHELIERNASVNLTAITEPSDIARKHFLDSFTAVAARLWTGREKAIDVGSGAGFPGLALRIALPQLAVTCVESVGKKARFLDDVSVLLGLRGVEVRNGRAEDLAHERGQRASYDVATARAVGSLGACAEYMLPLLRVGGEAIVWKGRIDAELAGAERALAAIGGEITAVVPTASLGVGDVLPGRQLVVMRKTRATPDRYPRASAEARRRPWGPATERVARGSGGV